MNQYYFELAIKIIASILLDNAMVQIALSKTFKQIIAFKSLINWQKKPVITQKGYTANLMYHKKTDIHSRLEGVCMQIQAFKIIISFIANYRQSNYDAN